jgi:hypothetical protein
MRLPVLTLSLALGVPACVDYSSTPSSKIVVPQERIEMPAADRLFLEQVRSTSPAYAADEWAGWSI